MKTTRAEKIMKDVQYGDRVLVRHDIFGKLILRLEHEGKDDKGLYWIGVVDDDDHMSDREPVKFRLEDVIEGVK